MKPLPVRQIWCDICHGGSPQKHTINYKGTDVRDKMTVARFESECLRCKERAELGLQVVEAPKKHAVPIVSFNALIQREIYDMNTAI